MYIHKCLLYTCCTTVNVLAVNIMYSQQCSSCKHFVQPYNCRLYTLCKTRAGHATILPRQHDHVFRPQSFLLLQHYNICCGYSILPPRPKYFSNFFWSLRLYYVVALSLSRSWKAVACPALCTTINDRKCTSHHYCKRFCHDGVRTRDKYLHD